MYVCSVNSLDEFILTDYGERERSSLKKPIIN